MSRFWSDISFSVLFAELLHTLRGTPCKFFLGYAFFIVLDGLLNHECEVCGVFVYKESLDFSAKCKFDAYQM